MKIYLEKLLEGFALGLFGNERSLVREIESKAEFNKMSNGSRGAIVDGKLYMAYVSTTDTVTHSCLLTYLQGQGIVDHRTEYNVANLPKMLMVIKIDGVLYRGESYGEFKSQHHDIAKKHFKSISYLGIKTSLSNDVDY